MVYLYYTFIYYILHLYNMHICVYVFSEFILEPPSSSDIWLTKLQQIFKQHRLI